MTTMRIFLPLLLAPTLLLAYQKPTVTHPGAIIDYDPWFTGPALAPTAVNMELGHPAIEPVITVFNNYATYSDNWKSKGHTDVWTVNYLVDFQLATTKRTGVEVYASYSCNYRNGESFSHFTDTILLLGLQVLDDQKDSWIPDFRLAFETIFPTGNFRELDPLKNLSDQTGLGAYFFGPSLSFQKLFYLDHHFFVLHWAISYLFPTRAHLKDLSLYGGGLGTRGSIRPGQLLTAYVSGEYSINQRWVIAFDTLLIYQQPASNFRGTTLLPVANPTTVQLSFAPQIQYNLSKNSGFIFGSWFTLLGRNANAFASLFLAYTHIF